MPRNAHLSCFPVGHLVGTLLLAIFFACPAAHGADWQSTGWGGGGFYFAAAWHPTKDGVIYMGGDSCGAYKTEDHGRNWQIINNGLANYAVYSMAVSPSEPETVFAATEDGLCKSTDGGAHWRLLPQTGRKELRITGERNLSIRSIAVDPRDGRVVYAASPGGRVYKSTDGGQSWAVSYERKPEADADGGLRIQFGKINGEYFGDFALPVVFPAETPATDCAGIGFTVKGDGSLPKDCFLILKTSGGASFRSKNLHRIYQEKQWRDIVLSADDFVVDPSYVKTHPEAAGKSFTTSDWPQVVRLDLACSGALPTEATVAKFSRFFFAITAGGKGKNDPAEKSRLAVFRDLNLDNSMQTFGNLHVGAAPSGTIYSVAVSSADPSRVIAATRDEGMVLSLDAGKTWSPLNTPTPAANAAFDPSDANIIYGAFFKQGVLKSTDAGKTWKAASKDFAANSDTLEVAIDPVNPRNVYAIASVSWNGAFYRSNDAGETWAKSSKVAVDHQANPTLDSATNGTAGLSAPRNIAINPRNPREIFLAANWRPCLSTDGGETWTERDRGTDISCISDIRIHRGKIYVTAMDEGTLVSEDNGQSWRQLWPLRHTPGFSGHGWRLAIDDVNGAPRILNTVTPWYKTPICVVRSDNGGKTFSVSQAGLPDYYIRPNTMWGQGHARALSVDPSNPQIVYLGIDGDPADGKCGGGVFRSQDGGTTWKQLPNQPGSRRMFNGLFVDPTNPKRIFWGACGTGGGVYRSDDQGNSWKLVFRNENFIWDVLVTPRGDVYCTGTHLWHSADHGATWKQLTHFAEKRSIVGLEVHPRDPQTIWVSATTWNASANGGVFKTTDGGKTWHDMTGDIPFVKPCTLRFNADTNELWAGRVGLYKIKQP